MIYRPSELVRAKQHVSLVRLENRLQWMAWAKKQWVGLNQWKAMFLV